MPLDTASLRRHWQLDPAIAFLNHGSFGACPTWVLEEQRRLRDQMEREPVRFFVREYEPLLARARERLGAFVGSDPDLLAFVPNATWAVNAILRNLELAPGDELLTTDHEYRACANALEYAAARAGARTVVATVPFPISGPGDVVDAVLERVTPRTRLALLDHVTSQTGLVWPIETLVRGLDDRGVDTLVDGAHAPGMLQVDLAALGAAYYTFNCHKWICSPKGAAALYVRADRRSGVRPLAISHGASWPTTERSRFRVEFDWTGTGDPTAYLSVPAALDFMGGLLPGGWPELQRRNRETALAARRTLADVLGVSLPCPDSMIGSLAALPLPDGSGELPSSPLYTDPLQDRLLHAWRIEVPVVPWPEIPKRLLRISAAVYNEPAEYARLAEALRAELGRE